MTLLVILILVLPLSYDQDDADYQLQRVVALDSSHKHLILDLALKLCKFKL